MASTLFTNGYIWPGTSESAIENAMAINGSKIIALGDAALSTPCERTVDLKGGFISPSFADGHAHPLFGGRQSFGPQITGLETIEEILAEIERFADANQDLEWIIGGTYDPAIDPNGNFDAKLLDSVVPDRPVVLNAMDFHTIWVNSEAMKRTGVDTFSGDLEIGTVVRRPDGSAMGTLREWDAVNLVMDKAPLPSVARELKALEYSSKRYASVGITWWLDAWVDRGMAEAYLAAEEAGVLLQGVNLAFRADPRSWQKDLPYFLEQRALIEASKKNQNLTAKTIKFFADGVIEGGTAALLEPYTNDPCYHGMPVWKWEEMTKAVIAMDLAGFQIHIHAIGDAGIRASLDALEAAIKTNPTWDRRPTIVHVQLLDPADLPRFTELGIIANFGPLWTRQDPMQAVSSAPRIGPERTDRQYLLRSLIDNGTRVAFGSDWPVTSEIPLEGIAVPVHRQTPDRKPEGGWMPHEAITIQEAFQAYTHEVAYQAFEDNNWGTLAEGFNADFIVLDTNPFAIDPHDVPQIKVVQTYRNGEVIYSA
jgi:predicted amidohydrolase YtcJ